MNGFIGRVAFASCLVAIFAITVSAQKFTTYEHEPGGIQFDAPTDWDFEPDEDAVIVSSKDGSIAVLFYVIELESLDAAADALGQEIAKEIKSPEFTQKGESVKVNGMEGYVASGKGKTDDIPVDFIVMVVMGKKPVMIFAMAESAALKNNPGILSKVTSSIRPLD